jgi:transcriptional regulator with XRE-family HTH domain
LLPTCGGKFRDLVKFLRSKEVSAALFGCARSRLYTCNGCWGSGPEMFEKLSKVTEMDRFGVRFGRLVREKRGIEGLSQDSLAEKSGLPKGRISDIETGKIEIIEAANAALGQGDFGTADDLLKGAEMVQLQSSTIPALEKQAKLRIERGNAALLNDDMEAAVGHFERSSRYFSGVDDALEAANRHECAMQLRYYGYRYKSREALYAARNALQQNLGIWKRDNYTEKWGQTKNALGGVSFRLAQFDIPENAMSHLTEAKGHYEDVLAVCSEEFLPKTFATAQLDRCPI